MVSHYFVGTVQENALSSDNFSSISLQFKIAERRDSDSKFSLANLNKIQDNWFVNCGCKQGQQ